MTSTPPPTPAQVPRARKPQQQPPPRPDKKTRLTPARVVRWGYTRHDGVKVPGAIVTNHRHRIFVDAHRLRALADRLHDIADDLEQESKE